MGAITKFKHSAVVNQIRHCNRTIRNNSNTDIDPERTHLNYCLTPERPESEYEYYLKRKAEVYCYNRSDVNTMVGWVITAPKTLKSMEEERAFFLATNHFLKEKYSEKNCVCSYVHYDEGKTKKQKFLDEYVRDEKGKIKRELVLGRPHLHFYFIPIVDDPKHIQGEKICANTLLCKRELQQFHRELMSYLTEHGIKGADDVLNGSTKAQGRNYTVNELKEKYEREEELKRLRKIEQLYTHEHDRTLFH